MKILVVDDEKLLVKGMKFNLENEGYEVMTAYDGAAAVELEKKENFDLIVMDVMMPGLSGSDACMKIREFSDVPVIMLTARSEDSDKVSALDAGADDYLTKPFSVEELLARLRVALRRVRYDTQKTDQEASVYQNGALKIDYAGGCAYRGEQEIHLTPIEYKLLCLLAKNTGKVLTHNYILSQVWGNSTASDTPSLRVFMATLRKKLETDPSHPQYIQTHIGVGYRMLRQKETPDAS